MTKSAVRTLMALPFGLCLLLPSGCHDAPKAATPSSGAQVFLQSEQALDNVHKFQIHIETKTAAPMVTDAKLACDQDVTWYQTTRTFRNSPTVKDEYVRTAHYLFSRRITPESSSWSRGRKEIDPGVCDRLKTPSVQSVPSSRLVSIDQSKAVPPFSTWGNEQGAKITHDGDEVVDDVSCEIWTIHHAEVDDIQSIWIASDDHLPRKYVEGDRNNPITIVTYTAYEAPVVIPLPPSDMGY